MMAAPQLLQNLYISTVINTVDLYIYIYMQNLYTHTLFSYVIDDIFYLYTFLDVIVFNMLKVIRIFCFVSFMCFFSYCKSVASQCF